MLFGWNVQLLTRYSFFRNLPCSTTNHLRVNADRIFVELNNSDVTRAIVVDIFHLLWQDRVYDFFTKLSFIVFLVGCFFLMSHFLVAEDYELSKSTSHLLGLPLTLKYVINSILVHFICLPMIFRVGFLS